MTHLLIPTNKKSDERRTIKAVFFEMVLLCKRIMIIIAHRSGPEIFPEQTVESAEYSIKHGADMVEVDTRFTKDNCIVISHDMNVERVFGVDKDVCSMTREEFLELRHKNAREYRSHMLADYIERGIAPLLIHVKEGGERLGDLLEYIKKYNYSDKTVFGVTSVEDVNAIRERDKEIPILGFIPSVNDIETFGDMDINYIRLWEDWVNDENVKRVKDSGKELWIMAGNGLNCGYTRFENIKKWEEMGADAILINEMDFAFGRR